MGAVPAVILGVGVVHLDLGFAGAPVLSQIEQAEDRTVQVFGGLVEQLPLAGATIELGGELLGQGDALCRQALGKQLVKFAEGGGLVSDLFIHGRLLCFMQ